MSRISQLCNGNRQYVDNVEECKFAGKILGYEYKSARDRETFPVGCYYLLESNNIYFNINPNGKSSSDSAARQICKMKGK